MSESGGGTPSGSSFSLSSEEQHHRKHAAKGKGSASGSDFSWDSYTYSYEWFNSEDEAESPEKSAPVESAAAAVTPTGNQDAPSPKPAAPSRPSTLPPLPALPVGKAHAKLVKVHHGHNESREPHQHVHSHASSSDGPKRHGHHAHAHPPDYPPPEVAAQAAALADEAVAAVAAGNGTPAKPAEATNGQAAGLNSSKAEAAAPAQKAPAAANPAPAPAPAATTTAAAAPLNQSSTVVPVVTAEPTTPAPKPLPATPATAATTTTTPGSANGTPNTQSRADKKHFWSRKGKKEASKRAASSSAPPIPEAPPGAAAPEEHGGVLSRVFNGRLRMGRRVRVRSMERNRPEIGNPTDFKHVGGPEVLRNGASATDDRRRARPAGEVFGATLQDAIKANGSVELTVGPEGTGRRVVIPLIVKMCVEFVEKYGLTSEGIYRLSASTSALKELKRGVEAGEVKEFTDDMDVNLACALLKSFIRELAVPVVPFDMFNAFMAVSKYTEEGPRSDYLHILVDNLPDINRDVFIYLIHHFRKIVEQSAANRMNVGNVCIVFAPSIFRTESESSMDMMSNNSAVCSTLAMLISSVDVNVPLTHQFLAIAKALFAFEATEDGIMSLTEGDTLFISDMREGEWWTGTKNMKAGHFPANYVQVIRPILPKNA